MNKEIDFFQGYSDAIRAVVPEQFFIEAERIVISSRPEWLPADLEFYNMAGISREDHFLLNGIYFGFSEERQREIFDEKRVKYDGDPVALQEIDVYDFENEYHSNLREFYNALRSGDTEKEEKIERWFEEYYPDIQIKLG